MNEARDRMRLPLPLQDVRERPGMYLASGAPSFEAGAELLNGYDMGTRGGFLVGFREWLIVRCDDGNNLWWPALVELLMKRRSIPRSDVAASWEFLFSTTEEFLKDRDGVSDGLRRIHLRYEHWLHQQDWYDENSAEWIELD